MYSNKKITRKKKKKIVTKNNEENFLLLIKLDTLIWFYHILNNGQQHIISISISGGK